MKLSEIFNVDLDLYARNKDYSKYQLPPLSQFFGIDWLNLEEKQSSTLDNINFELKEYTAPSLDQVNFELKSVS